MVRFKNRFLLLELQFDPSLTKLQKDSVTSGDVYHAISNVLLEIQGESGLGALKNSLSVKVFNEATKIMLVRTSRENWQLLASCVPFIRKLGAGQNGMAASVKTIFIGASIRSCERALISYHRHRLLAQLPRAQNLIEKKSIIEALDGLANGESAK